MRIIAGIKKGYKISAPKHGNTRPTSDMVRGAIFNMLEHSKLSLDFEDKYVLDLFAGSGALGLEAISRGPKFAYFIEQNKIAVRQIYANIEYLSFDDKAKSIRADVLKFVKFKDDINFDVIFIDPPYGKGLGEKACKHMADIDIINNKAVIILEEDARSVVEVGEPFKLLDKRIYGNTAIYVYRYML